MIGLATQDGANICFRVMIDHHTISTQRAHTQQTRSHLETLACCTMTDSVLHRNGQDGAVQRFVDSMRVLQTARHGPTFDQICNRRTIDPTKVLYGQTNDRCGECAAGGDSDGKGDVAVDGDGDEISYLYTIEPHVCITQGSNTDDADGNVNAPQISLGTWVALLDQATSCAIYMVREGIWSGVSVVLDAQHVAFPTSREVLVKARVTKVGRSLAFCRVAIHDHQTGALVCIGSHINFLSVLGNGKPNPGKSSNNNANTNKGVEAHTGLTDASTTVQSGDAPQGTEMDSPWRSKRPCESMASTIFPYLRFESPSIATFDIQPPHQNYGGALHGGCQAVVMELVGLELAKQLLRTTTHNTSADADTDTVFYSNTATNPLLESIQVKYKSRATGRVVLKARKLFMTCRNGDGVRLSMLVSMRNSHGRLLSEGQLEWSAPNPQRLLSAL